MSENSSSPDQFFCGSSINEELLSITLLISKFSAVVPLSVFVLCLGYQRRRRSSKTSNSDVFTYNSAALQLLFGLSAVIYLCGHYSGSSKIKSVGVYGANILFPGEINLQILTCMDQYLAVVHPIFYRRLKQSAGIRIRNAFIFCVWLLCAGWGGLILPLYPAIPYTAYFSFLAYSVISISFCSLSVLCVLIQPGPGKGGKKKQTADKSKRRAYLTITAILSVLLIYFLVMTFALIIKNSNVFNHYDACLFLMSAFFFGVPSSLILPLLFLRKAKKLQCFKCSKQ